MRKPGGALLIFLSPWAKFLQISEKWMGANQALADFLLSVPEALVYINFNRFNMYYMILL